MGVSAMTSRNVLAAAVAGLLLIAAAPAHAECTRLGFSVNDYGKEGPMRDAKELLGKYIEKWTAERGIKKYTVSQETMRCELFLDFIVFDEHTCHAEATVCWSGSAPVKKN
jgi:hypothetical protein